MPILDWPYAAQVIFWIVILGVGGYGVNIATKQILSVQRRRR